MVAPGTKGTVAAGAGCCAAWKRLLKVRTDTAFQRLRTSRSLFSDKLPQGALRESAFAAQMSAAAERDPKNAAKKVEALSGSADYPAAVRGFVDATAAKDPAAAADWALSIGLQGGQRTAALEKAAAEYFRQKPDEARKWVASAPLSAEEYFLLTGFRR